MYKRSIFKCQKAYFHYLISLHLIYLSTEPLNITVTANSITHNSASLSWTTLSSSKLSLEIKVNAQTQSHTQSSSSQLLTGLSAVTEYTVEVKTIYKDTVDGQEYTSHSTTNIKFTTSK